MNSTCRNGKGISGNGGEFATPDRPEHTGELDYIVYTGVYPLLRKTHDLSKPKT